MSISTIGTGESGGPQEDPFEHVDCDTAMALLESKLLQRLGSIAQFEHRGIIGKLRLVLQRLLPDLFGSEITPRRIEQFFQFILAHNEASANLKFPASHEVYDRERRTQDEVARVVLECTARELREYFWNVQHRIRIKGSLDRAIDAVRKDSFQKFRASQEELSDGGGQKTKEYDDRFWD